MRPDLPVNPLHALRLQRRDRRSRFALLAALMVLALAATPGVARAHGTLKSSSPAADARLDAAPGAIRLMFTEVPELAFTAVTLRGPDGRAVSLGPLAFASDSRRAVVAVVRESLVAGTYAVEWRMAGADGHLMQGSFRFTVLPGARAAERGEAAGGVTAPGEAPPPAAHHAGTEMPTTASFDAGSPLYVAIRWLLYAGLLVAIGAVAFQLTVLGFLRRKQNPDSPMLAPARLRAATLGFRGALVVVVAAVLRLVAQSYAMHGAAGAFDPALVGTMLARTVWGWGWLLQIAGALVALAGFRAARRGGAPGWAVATLGTALLAFSPALSGHAAAAPKLLALAVLADGMHVVGAGGWLGSLLVVVLAGIPAAFALPERERGGAIAELINAFSPTALLFAGIVAATGVFAAWLHLGAVPALWETRYGRLLIVKLGILSVVALTGAYNWLRVKPTLGQVEGGVRIRRSALVELAVGALVLLATAILVATPTAMDLAQMRG